MTEGHYTVNSIVSRAGAAHNRAMKTVLKVVTSAVLLAACGPMSLYYRPGATVARLNTDQTACEVAALRDAPVATQIRQNPPVYVPGPTRCDASGKCVQYPGHWVSGGFYTVDVNAGLRGRVEGLCMAQKGYEPVQIPRCSQAVIDAAPRRMTERLPALTASSCVIPYRDGTWQIVNPVRRSSSG